jgi:hypothetical protein
VKTDTEQKGRQAVGAGRRAILVVMTKKIDLAFRRSTREAGARGDDTNARGYVVWPRSQIDQLSHGAEMRDDFPRATIEVLAKRVGQRCSNPTCRKATSGPHSEPSKSVLVGVAAHITAASPGGPRYDPTLSSDDRRDIGNGIWLCQSCAKLVDDDVARYTAGLLLRWRQEAETEALRQIESAPCGTSPSDLDALKEYSAQFDRAALQDALVRCGSYKRFAESLGDLISLLNTGEIQGRTLTKRRADFDDPEWRTLLEALHHELRELRGLYTSLVRSGDIDEERCTCGFRLCSMYHDFEERQQAVIDRLNAVLAEAELPEIRGVWGSRDRIRGRRRPDGLGS